MWYDHAMHTASKIIGFLEAWQKPYPPSIAEVARGAGCSKTNAYYHLCRLRDEGKVEWESQVARSLRLSSTK